MSSSRGSACLAYRPNPQTGTQFAVVDAGGSTVDTCVYEVERTFPKLQLKEVKNSDCVSPLPHQL